MSDNDTTKSAEIAKSAAKKNWFIRHKVLTVLLAIIGIAIISNATGGDKKNTASITTKPNNTQSAAAAAKTPAPTPAPTPAAKEPSVPAEYKSALSKATLYSNTQYMSKQGVYDQLTSEYGEKFSAAAAQYAIDNMKADWNANALAKANMYQSQQSMSPAAVHDQLTSAYGEKFTAAEADYAVQHLND